ncbi:MAG: metalloregulator ArsR/SmtB family transcription factor [Clostridia bacterium]|nr:metalloregulator ArsR/SmtB family transcription factor [Clostridia bacterium]
MKSNIKILVSPPMEFLYSLFALGTDKSFFEMVRNFNLEPNEAIVGTLNNMRKTLSRYIQQELKYFYDLGGLGYILYKFIVANPELNKVYEILEKLKEENADDLVLKIIQSVCKNTLPKEDSEEYLALKGNRENLLKLLDNTKFQDDRRKDRVIEAVENPEEIKLRFYLLLSQFYECSFKPVEGEIIKLLDNQKEKYEKIFKEETNDFLEQYIGIESLKDDGDIIIHISFFKYVSCHSYSSYSPAFADWFVLGIYSDLLFDDYIISEKLANFFKVLSDVNRIEILRLLSERSWFGQELAEKLNISPPTVSYHIGFLQQMGLVNFERADNRFYYSLNEAKLTKPLEEFKRLLGKR